MTARGLPAAPASTAGWRDFFDELAPGYEQVAFGTAGLARVSAGELATVSAGLAGRTPGRILDIGAGTGRVTRCLLSLGWHVTAFDTSMEMLAELGSAHPQVPTVHGILGEPLPFVSGSFDAVVSLRVLKYVDDLDSALGELARVVRPGGAAVLEFTNRRSVARLGYPNAPIHFVDVLEVERAMDRAGFRVDEVVGGTRLPQVMWARARSARAASAVAAVDRGIARVLGGARSPVGA